MNQNCYAWDPPYGQQTWLLLLPALWWADVVKGWTAAGKPRRFNKLLWFTKSQVSLVHFKVWHLTAPESNETHHACVSQQHLVCLWRLWFMGLAQTEASEPPGAQSVHTGQVWKLPGWFWFLNLSTHRAPGSPAELLKPMTLGFILWGFDAIDLGWGSSILAHFSFKDPQVWEALL